MEWKAALPKVLLSISVGYTALVAAVIGVQAFLLPVFATIMEGERMGDGCFRTHAVLFGVFCQGFPGAGAVEVLLDIPLILVLGPWAGLFELMGITESGDFKGLIRGAGMLAVAATLWAPLVYLFIRVKRAS